MRALHRKLLRDLSLARGQIATIATVVACGTATFVASSSTRDSLLATQARYYDESRFADVFATLERAPEPLASRLLAVPGVADAETRLVFDVTLDLPGSAAPAVARMVSLPPSGEPRQNLLHLRRGRLADPSRRDEVVVSEGFANAHRLNPGDTLTAVLNGRREVLRIVGVALSPEYVFPIRAGEPLPDDESFGVLWVARPAMAAAFDMDGAFNDVVFRLAPQASQAAVIADVDRLLDPWGGLGAYGRGEQTSNRFLDDEIEQQRVMATTIPPIFLGVAAFLLNVVLGRIVVTQREQIATLKALGYDNRALALHYLQLVALIVLAGTLAGAALGAWLGQLMTAQYTAFFRFPVLAFEMSPWTPILAGGVSFAAGAAGAIAALRRVVALAPAEAMRPPAPRRYHPLAIERLRLTGRLSSRSRMMLRSVAGRPLRFALGSLGVSCAVGIVVLGLCWRDALDHMLRVQFHLAERGDANVVFTRPVAERTVRELAHLPGVADAEGYRAVDVRLRAGQRSYRTAILGVPTDARLRRLLDARLEPIEPPAEGLLLTRQLAEKLHVAPGDLVLVDVREGERPQREVPVAALVDDLVGLSAYMDARALHRLLREGDTVNLAGLRVDAARAGSVYARLKELGGISTVTLKLASLEIFERTTATFVLFFTAILTAFAVAIAVGVVYNTARVALQEQAWELASLRVLGFTRAEVSVLLLGELALTLVLAIPAGLALGYLAAWGVARVHQTEMFRIPVVVSAATYARSALVVLGAGVTTALLVRRRIDRLDLVSVLKTRE